MAKRKPIVTNFLDDDAPEQQQQTQKSRSNKPRRSPINTDFLDDVQVETQAEQVQPEPTQPEPTVQQQILGDQQTPFVPPTATTIQESTAQPITSEGLIQDFDKFIEPPPERGIGLRPTPSIGPGQQMDTEGISGEDAAKAYATLIRSQTENLTPTQAEKSFRTQGENIAGSLAQGLISTPQGLLRAGEAVGLDFLKPVADKVSELSEYLTPNEMDYMLQTVAGAGSFASFFVPGLGVAKGAGLISKASPKLAKWLASGVSGGLEASVEAGFTYDEVLKETGDKDKARKAAAKTAALNSILIPLTNRFGIFGDAEEAWKATLAGMTNEGLQEASQEIISAISAEKPIDWKGVLESAGIGAILGGTTGFSMAQGGGDLLDPDKIDQTVKEIPKLVTELQDPRLGEQAPETGKPKPPKKPTQFERPEPPKMDQGAKDVPKKRSPIVVPAEFQVTETETAPQEGVTAEKEDVFEEPKQKASEERRKAKEQKKAEENKVNELNRQFKNARRKRNLFDVEEFNKLTEDVKDPEIQQKKQRVLEEIEASNKRLTDNSALTIENVAKRKFRKDVADLTETQQQSVLEEYNNLREQGVDSFEVPEIIKPQIKGAEDGREIRNVQAEAEVQEENVQEEPIRADSRQELQDVERKEKPKEVEVAAGEDQPQDDVKVDLEPSEAQKEAGNYKKGHIKRDNFDITVENPKGSVRTGTDQDGETWSTKMNNTYGYLKGTVGKDKDHLDVFLAEDYKENAKVFIVNQTTPDGKFDEHKVMMGFDNAENAEKAFVSNYDKGAARFSEIVPMSMEEFKKWSVDKAKTSQPAKADPVEQRVEEIKKQKKSGITIKEEVEIEETGEIVTIERDASEVLRDTDRKLDAYQQLMDCIK
jgi:hypothetical protein